MIPFTGLMGGAPSDPWEQDLYGAQVRNERGTTNAVVNLSGTYPNPIEFATHVDEYDHGDWHNIGDEATQFVAPATGLYRINAGLFASHTTNLDMMCSLRKNGSSFQGGGFVSAHPASNTQIAINFNSAIVQLNAGDFIEMHMERSITANPFGYGIFVSAEDIDPSLQYAVATRSSSFAITGGSTTTIDWNDELADVGGWHNSGVEPSKLIVPSGVTKVKLSASIRLAQENATALSPVWFRIKKNGAYTTAGLAGAAWNGWNTVPLDTGKQIQTGIINVNPGDYFEVEIYSEVNRTVTSLNELWFSIESVSRRYVMLSKTPPQATSSFAWNIIDFDQESGDTLNSHSNLLNPSRIIVPIGCTYVRFSGSVHDISGTNWGQIRLCKSGTINTRGNAGASDRAGPTGTALGQIGTLLNASTGWVKVTPGEYYVLEYFPETAVSVVEPDAYTWFCAEFSNYAGTNIPDDQTRVVGALYSRDTNTAVVATGTNFTITPFTTEQYEFGDWKTTSTFFSTPNYATYIRVTAQLQSTGATSGVRCRKNSNSANSGLPNQFSSITGAVVCNNATGGPIQATTGGGIIGDDWSTYIHASTTTANTASSWFAIEALPASLAGALVTKNASQAITLNTWTAVTFPSEVYDTGNYWVTGANSRLTITDAGYYRVIGQQYHTGTSFTIHNAIWVNGAATPYVQTLSMGSGALAGNSVVTPAIYLNSGDYVEMRANPSANVTLVTASGLTWMSIEKVPDSTRKIGLFNSTGAYSISVADPGTFTFNNAVYDPHGMKAVGTVNSLTLPSGISRVRISGGVGLTAADGKIEVWSAKSTGSVAGHFRQSAGTAVASPGEGLTGMGAWIPATGGETVSLNYTTTFSRTTASGDAPWIFIECE